MSETAGSASALNAWIRTNGMTTKKHQKLAEWCPVSEACKAEGIQQNTIRCFAHAPFSVFGVTVRLDTLCDYPVVKEQARSIDILSRGITFTSNVHIYICTIYTCVTLFSNRADGTASLILAHIVVYFSRQLYQFTSLCACCILLSIYSYIFCVYTCSCS